MRKDIIGNLGNFIAIGFISAIIHVIVSSQYPRGVSGMAPFLLFLSIIASIPVSLLVIYILHLKSKKRFYIGIIIFVLVNFLVLFFFVKANPFDEDNDSMQKNIDAWYSISLSQIMH